MGEGASPLLWPCFKHMNDGLCQNCGKPSSSVFYVGGQWNCRHCVPGINDPSCRLFEYGVENPIDPKGSTAHVRDIKARRIDPKTKTFFYYEKPKTYFFSK